MTTPRPSMRFTTNWYAFRQNVEYAPVTADIESHLDALAHLAQQRANQRTETK